MVNFLKKKKKKILLAFFEFWIFNSKYIFYSFEITLSGSFDLILYLWHIFLIWEVEDRVFELGFHLQLKAPSSVLRPTVQVRKSLPYLKKRSFWQVKKMEETSERGLSHLVVLFLTGGWKWKSSYPLPSAWTWGKRGRLSLPNRRVKRTMHLTAINL